MNNINNLLEQMELLETIEDLRNLGLTEEEVEGFINFYHKTYEYLSDESVIEEKN